MAYRIPPPGQPISLFDVQSEFGGEIPIAIDEYYGVDDGVPVSGTISLGDFYGTQGEFSWCDKDMSNMVVSEDQATGAPLFLSVHGERTTLMYDTDIDRYVLFIVEDDGSLSKYVGDGTVPDYDSFVGTSETEGFVYGYDSIVPGGRGFARFTIDKDNPALITVGTPLPLRIPADTYGGIRLHVSRIYDDGAQIIAVSFNQADDRILFRANSYHGDTHTYGDTIGTNSPNDYMSSNMDGDGDIVFVGSNTLVYFEVEEVGDSIGVVHIRFLSDAQANRYKAQISSVGGQKRIVMLHERFSESVTRVELIDPSGQTLPTLHSVDVLASELDYSQPSMFFRSECLMLAGTLGTGTVGAKIKLLKATVTENDISAFTTAYLSGETNAMGVRHSWNAGIQLLGNKWLLCLGALDYFMKSLTVDPYIIPDPPSGLPTLFVTDGGEGDSGATITAFDVSAAESGTITELASLSDMGGGDRANYIIIDNDRSLAFVTGATATSLVYALDISNPQDSAGWIVGSLNAYPSYDSPLGHMAYDKEAQILYISSGFDSFMICDVSDPANMTVIEKIATTDSNIGDVAFDPARKILFTTNRDTMWAFDVTDPHGVVQLAEYIHPDGQPFKGRLIFDADNTRILVGAADKGMGYMDITDVSTMSYVSLYTYDDGVVPDYIAYDSDGSIVIGSGGESYHKDEIYKIDITDISVPVLAESDTTNLPRVPSIDVEKKIVYIPFYDTTSDLVAINYDGEFSIVASISPAMPCFESALSSS